MKLDDLRKLSAQFAYPPGPEDYARFQQALLELGLDPDNLYQELEMSSPYVQVHQDSSYSNTMLSLHSHAFYEVLCCRNTCGAEYLVGTDRYRLQKGDILFVPPGVSHRPLLPETMPEPYIRDILWLSEEFVARMEQAFPHKDRLQHRYSSLLRTAHTKWEYLGDLLRAAVVEAEQQRQGWDVAVTAGAMGFLTHLKRALLDEHATALTAEKPELIEQAMAYIEANLSQKITLEDVARHLYVSKSTVSQTFRSKMGVSFHRCVTQRRLIAAKAMIARGAVLEDVSTALGFRDYSSFYRAFRQEYGISPRQLRKH